MALFWRSHKRKRVRAESERSTLRHVLWGIGGLLVIALVLYGVWHLTRLSAVTISNIDIIGGETVSHDEVRSMVNRELKGSYFLIVPKAFSLTYPHDRIVDEVSTIPRVYNVSVSRSNQQTLEVAFDEHIPHALLCESGLETATCYFLDEHGYAFSPAPPLRGGSFVRHIIEGTIPESGTQGIEELLLRKMNELMDVVLSELDFRVVQITYEETGDVVFHISGGGKLLISQDLSSQETFENLQSVLSSPEFSHIEPGNFNYIDLRFGNKVFVNEELLVATTTEEVIEGMEQEEVMDLEN